MGKTTKSGGFRMLEQHEVVIRPLKTAKEFREALSSLWESGVKAREQHLQERKKRTKQVSVLFSSLGEKFDEAPVDIQVFFIRWIESPSITFVNNLIDKYPRYFK